MYRLKLLHVHDNGGNACSDIFYPPEQNLISYLNPKKARQKKYVEDI